MLARVFIGFNSSAVIFGTYLKSRTLAFSLTVPWTSPSSPTISTTPMETLSVQKASLQSILNKEERDFLKGQVRFPCLLEDMGRILA